MHVAIWLELKTIVITNRLFKNLKFKVNQKIIDSKSDEFFIYQNL